MKDKSKPVWHIYAFMLLVAFFVFIMSWALGKMQEKWPQLGISSPNVYALFSNQKPTYVNLEEQLNLSAIDTTIAETLPVEAEALPTEEIPEEPKDIRQWLTYKSFPQGLGLFFDKLNALAKGSKKEIVRIIHFGYSQIENDRISNYLRNKLQSRYGGYGAGYTPLYNPTLVGAAIATEGKWYRYTNFANEKTKEIAPFGLWNSFASFSPYPLDSLQDDSIIYEAKFLYNGRKQIYHLAQSFTTCKLFYQLPKGKMAFQFFANDTISDTFSASKGYKVFTYKSPEKMKELGMRFSGNCSPRFFGVSFEPEYGVVFDNVPMRGSSGTFFYRNTGKIMAKMLNQLQPSLLILEYGGNVLPYLKDSAGCETYARYIGNQLKILHRLNPNLGIIFIGPADMSIKNGLYYETYPLLEKVRDELKEVVHANGDAYWDMYEAMGGKNSMPSWVEAEPALAANDYTHFSPKGASLIAEMFYVALEYELNKYNAE